MTSQIARFMGPTWDPPGSCRPHMGPMLVPWTLLSVVISACVPLNCCICLVLLQFCWIYTCVLHNLYSLCRARISYKHKHNTPAWLHLHICMLSFSFICILEYNWLYIYSVQWNNLYKISLQQSFDSMCNERTRALKSRPQTTWSYRWLWFLLLMPFLYTHISARWLADCLIMFIYLHGGENM